MGLIIAWKNGLELVKINIGLLSYTIQELIIAMLIVNILRVLMMSQL